MQTGRFLFKYNLVTVLLLNFIYQLLCVCLRSRAGDTQTPAASDLEAALRRLTPGAVAARRAALGSGLGDHDLECRTPDSIMSTGSSGAFSGGMSWKLPDKLQVVYIFFFFLKSLRIYITVQLFCDHIKLFSRCIQLVVH